MNRAAGPSLGCGGSAGTWRRAVPAPRTSQGAAPRVFVRSAARQPATARLMERAAPSHRVPLPLLLLLAGLSVLAAPGTGAGGGPEGRGRPGSTAPALVSPQTPSPALLGSSGAAGDSEPVRRSRCAPWPRRPGRCFLSLTPLLAHDLITSLVCGTCFRVRIPS